MGKKKKNTTITLSEFNSTTPDDPKEKQTEVYRPPEQRSVGGGGFSRPGFSDRGRDDEKNGNRRNSERKEDVVLDFKHARETQPQPQSQPQSQQQAKPNERFPRRPYEKDNTTTSRPSEFGARKPYFSNSSTPVVKPESPPISRPVLQTEKSDRYVPPGMNDRVSAPTTSAPKTSRFEGLLKSEKKVEDTKPAFSKILSGFARGPDLVTEIFALTPVPTIHDIVFTILQLTTEQQIYSLNWITDDGFKPLFQEYLSRDPENRFLFLVECQKFACSLGFPDDKKGLTYLSAIFYTLYKEDLVLESDIIRWTADEVLTVKALKSKALNSCANLLFWLENVEAEV